MPTIFGSLSNYFSRFYKTRAWEGSPTKPLFQRPLTAANTLVSGSNNDASATPVAWGTLADGTTINRSSPQLIGEKYFIKLSYGVGFAVGIRQDGTLWAWGRNNGGQLGDNTTIDKSSPVQIGTRADWVDVDCGVSHTMALSNDGTIADNTGLLYIWGLNSSGQLDRNDTINRSSPTFASAGARQCLIGGINAGFGHSVFADTTYTAYAVGLNSSGQLGDNTTVNKSTAVAVSNLTGLSIVQVSAGGDSSAFRTSIGTLWTTGSNIIGKLGNNSTINRSSPVQVSGSWNYVSMGTAHCLGINLTNSVWGWGSNANYRLGDGTSTHRSSPVAVVDQPAAFDQVSTNKFQPMSGTWKQISIGVGNAGTHGLAIRNDFTLWAWGTNSSGQCGINNSATYLSSPVQVGTSSWSMVVTGESVSTAITVDGRLFTWGVNGSGARLGDNTTINKSSPVQIVVGTSFTFCTLTKAIDINGRLWTWGNSNLVGDGGARIRSVPVQLGTSSWSVVHSGCFDQNRVAAAIDVTGRLFMWGVNDLGQLGDNSSTARLSPVQITGGGTWIAVNPYCNNGTSTVSCTGVKSDGTLWSWGSNASGQGGRDNSFINRSSPVQVGNDTNWSKVAGGQTVNHFYKSNGEIYGAGVGTAHNLQNPIKASAGTTTFSSPVIIGANADTSVIPSSGRLTFGYITTSGQGLVWGSVYNWALPGGYAASKVAAVGNQSVMLMEDDAVRVLGNNYQGVLGSAPAVGANVSISMVYGVSPVSAGTWNYENDYLDISQGGDAFNFGILRY